MGWDNLASALIDRQSSAFATSCAILHIVLFILPGGFLLLMIPMDGAIMFIYLDIL